MRDLRWSRLGAPTHKTQAGTTVIPGRGRERPSASTQEELGAADGDEDGSEEGQPLRRDRLCGGTASGGGVELVLVRYEAATMLGTVP